jgi:hypothetical protein
VRVRIDIQGDWRWALCGMVVVSLCRCRLSVCVQGVQEGIVQEVALGRAARGVQEFAEGPLLSVVGRSLQRVLCCQLLAGYGGVCRVTLRIAHSCTASVIVCACAACSCLRGVCGRR